MSSRKTPRSQIVIGQSVSFKIASRNLTKPAKFIFADPGGPIFRKRKLCAYRRQRPIEQVPVTTGEIVGENIYVTGGLTADMKILPSVRGFKEGDTVKIQENFQFQNQK